MAVLNPHHLLEQSQKLIAPPPAGPPRQVDVRRAISTAYYAVFHHILTAAADEVVGAAVRNTPRYWLVYRSVNHGALRSLCDEIRKQQLPLEYRRHAPPEGFGQGMKAFANAFGDLQEKRHSADYDPSIRLKTSDALVVIATARSALERFDGAAPAEKRAFISLLLFPPRRGR